MIVKKTNPLQKKRIYQTNVPALGEVADFRSTYFLLKIKFLAKRKRVLSQNSHSYHTCVT